MSNLAIIEKQMRHTVSKDAPREWRGEEKYSICERCNLEVHGSYVYDDDRGDIWCGWFSDGVNSKGNYIGITHCPDEFIADLKSEYDAILSKFLKK